jgi:hypothetical protein
LTEVELVLLRELLHLRVSGVGLVRGAGVGAGEVWERLS